MAIQHSAPVPHLQTTIWVSTATCFKTSLGKHQIPRTSFIMTLSTGPKVVCSVISAKQPLAPILFGSLQMTQLWWISSPWGDETQERGWHCKCGTDTTTQYPGHAQHPSHSSPITRFVTGVERVNYRKSLERCMSEVLYWDTNPLSLMKPINAIASCVNWNG